MLYQLLSGHTLLKQHRAKIDNSVSEICPVCSVREDPDHFLLYSKSYEEETSNLVEKVETIIEACIGGTKYPISLKVNRQVSLINCHNFLKNSISLEVMKILNTVKWK